MLRTLGRRLAAGLALSLLVVLPALARERIELAAGWRFQRGDPVGATAQLMYDLRPEVTASADGKVADARPDEAVKAVASAPGRVLKPWVLPSANPFIRDPAKRHRRPEGHPGSEVDYVRPGFDDSGWQAVTLPHDWAIAGPFLETGPYGGMGRLQTWGPVWYRRALDIPASDRGRSLFLDVDGAMSYATVWLNGRLVGGWPYGYNSFRLDLTPWARPGEANQLVIRLDNPPESARWYPGAGLYRSVWLTKTAPVHVAHWGTTVTTPQVSPERATVAVRVQVDNDGARAATVDVLTELYALGADGRPEGRAVARARQRGLDVPAGGQGELTATLQVRRPRLWGPAPKQQPHRYVAVTRLLASAGEVDRHETPFGIRTLRFDANTGLHVNGQLVKLQGVNLHHDLGALGTAFNLRAAERQLQILQAMGANAIRLAHNPPAVEFLDLCDRLGLLVVDEIFDSWERKKTPLDFHLIFPDWHEPDLRAMLRRDRNHPSIVMWSIGNEVGEQYTGAEGAAVARRLHAIAREEDPTRPTTTAMNFAKADMPLPAEVDVISLNYQGEGIRQDPEFIGTDRIRTPPQYPNFRAAFPGKLILSSETASAFSSRGVYHFPVTPAQSSITRDGRGGDSAARQVSGYELYAVDFGSSADKVFKALDAHPFVAGEFVWTGFDYLGEPTPYYAARSSYSGIVDLAGFPKDRYWLYQSRWRPELPMAHLLPHWTWPERVGQVTPVHAFTSGDEAELFLNGRSLGKRKKGPGEYRLRWDDVVYEPGTLTLQAYKAGQPWATARVETAGVADKLELQADRTGIAADGRDLSFITLRITDAQGRTVPRADTRVRFSIDSPGELVATDNGDASSFEPFPSASRRAFSGQALAIIRSRAGAAGRLVVRAEADGLSPAAVVITTQSK
ncbi:beta-galactosidase GalB [Roseateles sp. LKC17W]|uniref:Beta-galactosidase GalB n=1 Tax=Pelomonas margarita TaxID=3299031 RepID=A0ABW7FCL6_9BURK